MPRVKHLSYRDASDDNGPAYIYQNRYPMTKMWDKGSLNYGRLHPDHKLPELVVPHVIHECGHVCHAGHSQYEGRRRREARHFTGIDNPHFGCCRCRAVEDNFGVSIGRPYPRLGIEEDKLQAERKIKGYWAKATRFRWGFVKRFGTMRATGQVEDEYISNGLGLRSNRWDAHSSLVLKNGKSTQALLYPTPDPSDWQEAAEMTAMWNPSIYGDRTNAELVEAYKEVRESNTGPKAGYSFAVLPDEYDKHTSTFKGATHLGWHKGLARFALQIPAGWRRGRPGYAKGFDMLGVITGLPPTDHVKMCVHCRNAIKGIPDYLFWVARGYTKYAAMLMDRIEKEVIKQSKQDFQLEEPNILPAHEQTFNVKRGNVMPFVGCVDTRFIPDVLNKNYDYDRYHRVHQQDVQRWASLFREDGHPMTGTQI